MHKNNGSKALCREMVMTHAFEPDILCNFDYRQEVMLQLHS